MFYSTINRKSALDLKVPITPLPQRNVIGGGGGCMLNMTSCITWYSVELPNSIACVLLSKMTITTAMVAVAFLNESCMLWDHVHR